MERKEFGKRREICLPGEEVGSGELRPGSGTYRQGNTIFSAVVGLRSVRSNFVNVIPLGGKYVPRIGDQVIGYVTDVGPSFWLMDINSPYPAPLHGNDTPWKIDFGDTSKYLTVNNAVIVGVTGVDETKHIQVGMREHGHRKINSGSILEISPAKVPRIIGKGGSMISLLKDGARCRIFVGQNGRIWVDGEAKDMDLAITAINMIDQDTQSFGLTERIRELLGVKDNAPEYNAEPHGEEDGRQATEDEPRQSDDNDSEKTDENNENIDETRDQRM